MTTWQATIDLLLDEPMADGEVDGLVDLLAYRGGAVGFAPDDSARLSVVLTVPEVDSPLDACADAVRVVRDALTDVGAGVASEVGVEAITDDEADRRLAEPAVPELVAAGEAAEILGVSRQRVHQLSIAHPSFPEPVLRLSLGPLWTRFAVMRFSQTWDRRPGRRSDRT